ncbi:hypothetical protein LY90DRAFT_664182 [Neocallimastix californiae]|uniref:F-box domain-containing protein n=1 Tax=Neocallimastix californiae TaxID=1754190 RepID=A0A1Y2FCK9_9FUNG|nr:hypothetical protein LY90DRAFT_664182 [Neocallimastix californiae]|eukprot:ORY81641.1 hypothetical protein LY90DRAFT_664182 [Neocallimastix californiae]
MNINSIQTTSNRKQGFSKVKKILKTFLLRKSNSKKNVVNVDLVNNDLVNEKNKNSKKNNLGTNKNSSVYSQNLHSNNNNTLCKSDKPVTNNNDIFSESNYSALNENSSCSIGTWITEDRENSIITDEYNIFKENNNKNNNSSNNIISNNINIDSSNNIISNNINIDTYHEDSSKLPHSSSSSTMLNNNENIISKDKCNVLSSKSNLITSSSSNTLYVKDFEENYKADNDHHGFIDINPDNYFNKSFSSSESVSTPSTISLGSMYLGESKSNKISINKIEDSSLKNVDHKLTTPPILSYFPQEILIKIAMSSDFDTILNLSQTCRFFYYALNNPYNWSDYWKYTSDKVEGLNSLVTNVFHGDKYIFGEIHDLKDDKYVTKISKNTNHPNNQFTPSYIYKMSNNDSNQQNEIPIEKVLFIDSFSTRFGFSYLGGLRIYVPNKYGNIIVHFYDRKKSELPCSMEHHTFYENNQFSRDLTSSLSNKEDQIPLELNNCSQCADYYYQKNEVDYLVTCTGRPISHISAIWKYNVTPNYTISFDIINSRAELGYGNRTHDAFVHTNYSFLINGNELSPRKASLFRKFVIESPKKSL